MVMSGTGARITDEAVAALRARIGSEREIADPYNRYASHDTIRHFAHGLGDTNPLWLDEDYARTTRRGGLIAPPGFLLSCGMPRSTGLPGIHAMHTGHDWEFFRPVRPGDRITLRVSLHSLTEKLGQFAGRQFHEVDQGLYYNQDGELLARLLSHCMRTERDTAVKKGKYREIVPKTWTEEEIAAVDEEYAREEIRGSRPRYWEDVQVGDPLTPVVKGPLTLTDFIAWEMGWGGLYIRAHGIGVAYRKRHPLAYLRDKLGIPDIPERVHWDEEYARAVGAPGAYDYGPQRSSWVMQLVTNWMGDDGWLKRFKVEIRRFVIVGDLVRCKGRVVRKFEEEGERLVACEVWAENQRGEVVAPGEATVVLPSRSAG
jgi:acyl dehydratase